MTLRTSPFWVLALLLAPPGVVAAPDAAVGRRLVQSHQCETCHQSKVNGPEGAIYLRQDRKVTTWSKLKAQVASCNAMLKLGLFPEDEEHIAAYLNQTYYKLPMK